MFSLVIGDAHTPLLLLGSGRYSRNQNIKVRPKTQAPSRSSLAIMSVWACSVGKLIHSLVSCQLAALSLNEEEDTKLSPEDHHPRSTGILLAELHALPSIPSILTRTAFICDGAY